MAWIELSSCEKKEKKKNYSLSIEEKREIVAIGPDELCTQKMLFVECEVVSSSSSSAVTEAHLVQVVPRSQEVTMGQVGGCWAHVRWGQLVTGRSCPVELSTNLRNVSQ